MTRFFYCHMASILLLHASPKASSDINCIIVANIVRSKVMAKGMKKDQIYVWVAGESKNSND